MFAILIAIVITVNIVAAYLLWRFGMDILDRDE